MVGISGYSTTTSGVPGSLKEKPEDFVVEEIPQEIPANANGKYQILKVRLTNWDTNRFLVYLAKYLGISKKRITYGGTKDKRGITTQYFCINHSFDPAGIRIADVEVLDSFRTDRMLGLGDLAGNKFTIDLRVDQCNIPAMWETYNQISGSAGFPNYFGLQRFGTLRTNTHKIGRLIINGELARAASTYIYDPEFDTEDYRVGFSIHNDPKLALKEFPERLSFERSLLGYMAEHGTLEGAFSVFPKNLSMMFVHAYQSYLFNRILSLRMKMDGIGQIYTGDVLLPVDVLFNSNRATEVVVNRLNLERMAEMVRSDRMRPTIPLIGYETVQSKGEQGEFEARIMEEEKVEASMFRIQGYADLSSKGERRITACKPADFAIRDDGVLKFSLGRGIYATSLLREFTKDKLRVPRNEFSEQNGND